MTFSFLFIIIIFLLGLLTSYGDFSCGKIKNIWIFWSLVGGAAVYFSFLAFGPFGFFSSAGFQYLGEVILNSFIALILGYLLWCFDLWAAGDAKLFFAFSFLLPLEYYGRSYLPYFPSFALLINTFVPALTFLLLQAIYYIFFDAVGLITKKGMGLFAVKVRIYFKNNFFIFFKRFLSFSLIFLFFQIFRQAAGSYVTGYQWWQAVFFLLFFAVSRFFQQLLKKTYIFILSLLIFILYMIFKGFEGLNEIVMAAKSSIIFLAAFLLIMPIFSYSQRKINQKKIAFAVWLFVGVIITIILKGSLMSFLFNPHMFRQ